MTLIVLLSIWVGGLAANPGKSIGVTSNCLLYASPFTNTSFTAFSEGFNLPGNSACQSGVIEGVVAIMTSIFMGVVTIIYLGYVNSLFIAKTIAVLSTVLSFFVTIISAIASIGFYQTCANTGLCTRSSSEFSTQYSSTQGAVLCGWIASAILFLHAMNAWFEVGVKSTSTDQPAASSAAPKRAWGNGAWRNRNADDNESLPGVPSF